jgi:hypothetical protein
MLSGVKRSTPSRTRSGSITSSRLSPLPAPGMGIFNYAGTVRLTNGSQFTINPASFHGGGIANLATLIIVDSTVSGNTANGQGGGIYNLPGSTATLQNGSSVTGNLANGGIVNVNGGTVTLQNGSNISGNTGGNCLGSGYNPNSPTGFCAP